MTRYIFVAFPRTTTEFIDIINLGWGCRALCLIIQTTIIRPRFVSFSCRLADLMDQHKEELATLESVDYGSVYTLALKTNVGFSIDTFRYFIGWCDKIQGSTIPINNARPNSNLCLTKREPSGYS